MDNLIDSSDLESLDQTESSVLRFCNTPKSETSLINCLKEDYLDEDFKDRSSWLMLKTRN